MASVAKGRRQRAAKADSIAAQLTEPPVSGLKRTLLDVGLQHFAVQGFHNASVAQIAEQAGTSVGLLYYHFGSKEGMYRAIWADYQQRQHQRTHEAIKLVRSAGITDGRTLFLVGTRAYVSNAWENRDVVKLFYVNDVPPGFVAESRAITEEWVRMNTRLLNVPDNLATKVMVEMAAAAIGVASRLISLCSTQDEAEEVVETSMRIFARLVGAEAEPIPAPA
ncbi:TetR/AcrR family transcriptional regulator [Paractinoplanes globisporus]|uniref:TetR/AcrR family transcriptional regulator n=1 Tax=Paractinoplanes globisporus TaxID=113565 RepID=A0ABW6W8Z4_9ACTN|nr:TetR/AcrR family transcriptional regulator [Actinoplanes globisporus]